MADKKNKHTLLKAVGMTAIAGAAAYGGSGYYAFRKLFVPDETNEDTLTLMHESEKEEWLKHSEKRDAFIDSYDGLKLHGVMIANHPESHEWMIAAADGGTSWQSLLHLIYEADHRDMNVLAIDERGYGMSEGRYTTLGWCEHYDLISWVSYITRMDASSQIVLYGIGTGGLAVMNASGDFMPKNVFCAIEEGGANGVRELVNYRLSHFRNIDARFIEPSVDLFVRKNLHFSMSDISTRHQLQNAHIPVMFIHGSEDQEVPTSMVFDNFYTCTSRKEIMVTEGAGHSDCFHDPEYAQRIFRFIASCL